MQWNKRLQRCRAELRGGELQYSSAVAVPSVKQDCYLSPSWGRGQCKNTPKDAGYCALNPTPTTFPLIGYLTDDTKSTITLYVWHYSIGAELTATWQEHVYVKHGIYNYSYFTLNLSIYSTWNWWAILQLLIKWVQDVSSRGSLSTATGYINILCKILYTLLCSHLSTLYYLIACIALCCFKRWSCGIVYSALACTLSHVARVFHFLNIVWHSMNTTQQSHNTCSSCCAMLQCPLPLLKPMLTLWGETQCLQLNRSWPWPCRGRGQCQSSSRRGGGNNKGGGRGGGREDAG